MALFVTTAAVLGHCLATPALALSPGDPNHDHVIDLGDINLVTAHWLETGLPGFEPADCDGNGVVDMGDINFLTARWLNTGEPSGIDVTAALGAIPEPQVIPLVIPIALSLLGRRSRREFP